MARDGAAKIVIFHGETITQLIAAGRDLRREAFLVACFGRYLAGIDDSGGRFDVVEPHIGEADWRRLRGGDPLAVLDIGSFQGLRLRQSASFREAYQDISGQLASQGTAATLTQLLM